MADDNLEDEYIVDESVTNGNDTSTDSGAVEGIVTKLQNGDTAGAMQEVGEAVLPVISKLGARNLLLGGGILLIVGSALVPNQNKDT